MLGGLWISSVSRQLPSCLLPYLNCRFCYIISKLTRYISFCILNSRDDYPRAKWLSQPGSSNPFWTDVESFWYPRHSSHFLWWTHTYPRSPMTWFLLYISLVFLLSVLYLEVWHRNLTTFSCRCLGFRDGG